MKGKLNIMLIIVFLLTSLFIGCTEEQKKPGDLILPTIISFTSDNLELELGETANLSWIVENATSVSISSSTGSFSSQDSLEVEPQETTTYILTAVNNIGNTTDSLTITVNEPYIEGTPVIGFTQGQNYLLITFADENLSWSNVLLNSEAVTINDVDHGQETWNGIIHKGDRLTNLSGTVTLVWNPTDQTLGTWDFTIA